MMKQDRLLLILLMVLTVVRIWLNYDKTGRIVDVSLLTILILLADGVIKYKNHSGPHQMLFYQKTELATVIVGFVLVCIFNTYSHAKLQTPLFTLEQLFLVLLIFDSYQALRKSRGA